MRILRNVEDLSSDQKVLCIGNFDGVHIGHQDLLRAMSPYPPDLERVVLSFQPHPMEVLNPGRDFFKTQQSSEGPSLLAEYHIDTLILQAFTREFNRLGPDEFIVDWLIPKINPRFIVVGKDFNFGHGQAGNVELLKSYETRFNFEVMIVPTVILDGKRVSSTLVREALSRGDMTYVSRLLGRSYFLEGVCQQGKGRGRELGFPTLNIPLEDKLSICRGVYVCCLVDGKTRHSSIANIGRAPTVHQNREMALEVHMLDFVDVCGKVRVELLHFLRKEVLFPDQESLVAQIKKDVEKAKAFFQNHP